MTAIEFTHEELRTIAKMLEPRWGGAQKTAFDKVKAQLPDQPVRCYHCRQTQTSESGYERHLRKVHHYGNSREDGAEVTAWKAFHSLRV